MLDLSQGNSNFWVLFDEHNSYVNLVTFPFLKELIYHCHVPVHDCIKLQNPFPFLIPNNGEILTEKQRNAPFQGS